jgi:hypothetical protein
MAQAWVTSKEDVSPRGSAVFSQLPNEWKAVTLSKAWGNVRRGGILARPVCFALQRENHMEKFGGGHPETG